MVEKRGLQTLISKIKTYFRPYSFVEGTLIIEQHGGIQNLTKQFESPQQCFAITKRFENKRGACL